MSAANTNITEEQKANATSDVASQAPELTLSEQEDRTLGYIERKALNTITRPGKYSVRVSNTREGITNTRGELVTIINFAAITQYQLEQAYEAFGLGMLEEAGNYGLSSNARVGTNDFCPSPGEHVFVQIEERPTKAGVDKFGVMQEASVGLFVTSVTPQPPVAAVASNVREQIMLRRAEAAAKLAGK
jgi:hypothetical protein